MSYFKATYSSIYAEDDPLLFFIGSGRRLRLKPNRWFDTDYYISQAPRLTKRINPLTHYLRTGAREGRQPSIAFNSADYLAFNPDVAAAGMDPFIHYLWFGIREGRPLPPSSSEDKNNSYLHEVQFRVPAKRGLYQTAPGQPDGMLISIIIVTRNGGLLLDQLFRSFLKYNRYPNFEFIVVDHASDDNSKEVISAWTTYFPVSAIYRDDNYSFSESNNLGVKSAKGKYILLLNNDVLFSEDILTAMVSRMADNEVGIAGIKQFLGNTVSTQPPEIYHIGIRFRWRADERFLRPYNVRPNQSDAYLAMGPANFFAVTASLLLCRRADYLNVGGLNEGYVYGFEDVDFNLKIRWLLGKDVVCLNDRAAFHNESTTRNKIDSALKAKQRLANRRLLQARCGYPMRREFKRALFGDDGSILGRRFTVAFAVTTTDTAKGAGDLYTAWGLGHELQSLFGWDVRYLAQEEWYEARGIDLYIAMRDDVDLFALKDRESHLVTVAWLRNWLERWIEHPWFDLYDVYLCSSSFGSEYIWDKRKVRCSLFPIAVSLDVFDVGPEIERYKCDYCFTGNYWKAIPKREIESFDPKSLPFGFKTYGKAWDTHPTFAPFAQGFLPYSELSRVYNSAKITVDDTVTHVTKLWGSANSRIFEAIASGSLVLTNNAIASDELFGGILPVWNSADELGSKIRYYLENEHERLALLSGLRAKVINEHTYALRARALHNAVEKKFSEPRIAIKCPVPARDGARYWGDYHFARSLQKSLCALGYHVRTDILPDWYGPQSLADDIVIVLRGLTEYEPSPDQINLCWLLSHPDKTSHHELDQYDHVFVASTSYAQKLGRELSTGVSELLQCSNPDIFYPPTRKPASDNDLKLLFVGNSRRQSRKIVSDCIEAGLPLSVYGRDWEGLIRNQHWKGDHIPNEDLHAYYGTAHVTLNDHWPDMAREGFVSNRLFDIGLAGGVVISDKFAGSEIFGDLIMCCEDPQSLKAMYATLGEGLKRTELSQRFRRFVLEGHTFQHRAREISAAIESLVSSRQERFRDAPLIGRQ
jgi:GT2 family glycosyltransferase/spore maturation protein CgeB